MNRLILRFLVLLLALPLGASAGVAAQDATPASAFADLGLPTLDITITANAYEGIPETLEAGRYLVNVDVAEDAGEFGGGVAFIQPSGMTGDEFVTMLGELMGPPDESGVGEAAATPVEGGAATPVDAGGGEEGGPPPFMFESLMAGGTYAPAGESAQVVLDLPPGEWVAWSDDPAGTQTPVAFQVTGEMPADLVEPESSATITMSEYAFEVTEGELTAGHHILKIENIGDQPHFVSSGSTTKDVTEDDIMAVLESEMTGTPPAVDFNPETDFQEAFYSGTQSSGTAQWIVADIQPGTLIMLCFFPDVQDGMPHAYHGMVEIVEIGE